MCAGAGVLRLERAREGRHRLQVGTLQQLALPALDLEQVAQVARVEEQLFLGPCRPLLRRTERDAVEAAGETLGDGEQLERAEGLPDERIRSDALGGRA